MTKDLHNLSPEELGKLFPIHIAKHNPSWPEMFLAEKRRLYKLLGKDKALNIEHFGSTAVPGLAAKPTIDILVGTLNPESINQEIIDIMKSNGYDYILRKDSPPPYMMFVKGYTPDGFKGQCYHIHMAPGNHAGLWDRLYFRDYLISHPETAREYERLKRALAVEHPYNREKYTDAKKEFVQRITRIAKTEQSG